MHRVALLLFALLPAVAHAEVLDKELPLSVIVCCALLGSAASFFAARYRPWLLALVLPAVTLVFGAHLSELLEPAVGRAMAVEGGIAYMLISWSGPFFALAGCILGFIARGRSGKAEA